MALLRADIANKAADTAYKEGLLKYEPWKLTALAFGAGATVMGAIIGLLTLVLRH